MEEGDSTFLSMLHAVPLSVFITTLRPPAEKFSTYQAQCWIPIHTKYSFLSAAQEEFDQVEPVFNSPRET